MKKQKLLKKLLSGSKNIRFLDIVNCAKAFGFHLDRKKRKPSYFVHPNVPEMINLQNVGGKAKPYQVKQFLNIVERYNLEMEQ